MPLYKIMLAIVAMMIFGLGAVISKAGLQEFPPLFFNLARFAVLLPLIAFIKRPNVSWPLFAAISITLGVLHLSLANVGMWLGASAGMYVLLLQTGSLFVLGFAYLFFGIKPTRFDLAGIGLGLIGIYIICAAKGTAGGPLAIVALIASAAMWALGFTLVKKAQAPSVPMTTWMSILVLPFLGVSSLSLEGTEKIGYALQNATYVGWGAIFYTAFVSMVFAGGILMYLMKTEPMHKVAPFNLLTPVFGCLFSVLLLGEQLSASILIGGLFILVGLTTSQFGQRIARWFRSSRVIQEAA